MTCLWRGRAATGAGGCEAAASAPEHGHAPAKPDPISKPLVAGRLSIALPSSASSLSNTGEPRPLGQLRMTHVTSPPTDSPRVRTALMAAAARLGRGGVKLGCQGGRWRVETADGTQRAVGEKAAHVGRAGAGVGRSGREGGGRGCQHAQAQHPLDVRNRPSSQPARRRGAARARMRSAAAPAVAAPPALPRRVRA